MSPPSKPHWVRLDHAGLVISPSPQPRDYGWWVFLLGLTLLWTFIITYGFFADGFSWTWALMSLGVPFFWWLTAMIAWKLATRRMLVLAADGLSIRTRFLRLPERIDHVPLRHATIDGGFVEGGKGWTHTYVTIEVAEPERAPRTLRFQLPGGTSLKDRQQSKEELQWVLDRLNAAVRAAQAAIDADEEATAATEAALAEMLRRAGYQAGASSSGVQ